MKKFIALYLIAIMAAPLYASCGDKDKSAVNIAGEEISETAAEETADGFAEDDLGEYDFGGYEFSMWSCMMDVFYGNLDVEEENGDVLDDSIYRRNRSIEERFNFTFKEIALDIGEIGWSFETPKKTILAGDNVYDIINIFGPNAYAWAQEGLVHSVKRLPHIDLDKPYWHQDLNKDLTIANKMYFASGAFNLTAYDCTEALLFNKDLVRDLGLDDLYALVHEGKWTFAKFAEYCLTARADLDGDGKTTLDDRHGFISTSRMVMPSFWIAGGVKSIYKDENDIPYLGAMEPSFVEVYDAIISYVRNNDAWFKAPNPNVQNDPVLVNLFKSGRALFFDNNFYTIKDLRDMEINFGILPFPKLNEDQKNYYTRLYWTELFCLPVSADEAALARTSVILEALACESAKYVIPAYYDVSLKTKMTRDVESEAMVDLLFHTRVFDFGDTVWNGYIRDGNFTALFEKGSTDLISTMQKIQNTLQKEIDKMVDIFEALGD
ncbi:MAG: extracellular solute-binding protein [Oscillospiraceae bacterium]|nr:extracellular solute-binding protein [Oscillospiraceae bacterium]